MSGDLSMCGCCGQMTCEDKASLCDECSEPRPAKPPTPDCPPKVYAFAYRDADGVKIEAYATQEETIGAKKAHEYRADDGRSAPAYGFVYLGPDLVLAKVAAAVKAERERIAVMLEPIAEETEQNSCGCTNYHAAADLLAALRGDP